jgi:hypothetical protein
MKDILAMLPTEYADDYRVELNFQIDGIRILFTMSNLKTPNDKQGDSERIIGG